MLFGFNYGNVITICSRLGNSVTEVIQSGLKSVEIYKDCFVNMFINQKVL